MPKQPRQKKYLSDAYLVSKARSSDEVESVRARMQLNERNRITEFIQGGGRKRKLIAESHGVELLFLKEQDMGEPINKGMLIQLYVRVDDAMTKGDYIANWPIVAEYVRQLKEVQWEWHEDRSVRFFESLEAMRVRSNKKMGYGKLAQWINRLIERLLRAKKRNELIEASVPGERYTPKWNDECLRKGYDVITDKYDADELLWYFDLPREERKEIIAYAETSIQAGEPPDFACKPHAYTGPVTAAHVRTKLLKLRRHLSK